MIKHFPNKLKKAVTFSFDDGTVYDIKLVDILNKYGLKCTFNLCAARISAEIPHYGDIRQLNYAECLAIYQGHEIASHGYTHPNFSELNEDSARNQIFLDKKILSCLFECDVKGFAYPYGAYDDQVKRILKEADMCYARTIWKTESYDLPKERYMFHPTCHFQFEGVWELAQRFIRSDSDEPQLLYLWGHSYELSDEKKTADFERLCKLLSAHRDIWYCTNLEIINSLEFE